MQAPLPEHAFATLGAHRVMRIGYGAMQIEHVDPDTATRLLRQAVDLGVNHLDTAEFYGQGKVNRAIKTALFPYRDDLQIVSKVGAVHTGDRLVAAQRPEQLRAAVEANLASLGTQQLAVVNLRRLDTPPGITAAGDQIVDLDSQLAELVALRDEGKIGAIGLSQVSLTQLQQAAPAGIVCVQNLYNVLERDHEATLRECERLDIAWVPFFPLGSGFAHLTNVTDNPVVIAQAARLAITPGQAGLAWLLAHAPQTLLIPGTRSTTHLVENINAARVVLDDLAIEAFDQLANSVAGAAAFDPPPTTGGRTGR